MSIVRRVCRMRSVDSEINYVGVGQWYYIAICGANGFFSTQPTFGSLVLFDRY
jgi:hypothetical protein